MHKFLGDDFLSLLVCPKTQAPLFLKPQTEQVEANQSAEYALTSQAPDGLSSTSSNTSKSSIQADPIENYPIMQGIPWLLKNPLHSMVDWSVKLNHFNRVLSSEIANLENEVKHVSGETEKRLAMLLEGKKHFQLQVSELVSPVVTTKVASKPIYDALSDRAPNTQNLLSYEANLYRDWVWGEDENAQTCEIVSAHIKENVGNMMVLGAGSCKLALDLHEKLKPTLTIANDINPLLLFAAKEIIFGEGLTIAEFPLHPRSSGFACVQHSIPPVNSKPNNFHLLFSDAAHPCIKQGSIDTLITPWLIDIQPYELSKFMRCLNHYLPIGGTWINFGSLVFNQSRDVHCYSIEEIRNVAHSAGFDIEAIEEYEIPYLKSPYNAGWRMERVWTFKAIKKEHKKQTEDLQTLPDWSIDPQKIVPKTAEIEQFVFTHKTYSELCANIDGKHTLIQLARKLAKQQKMDEKEALAMIKNFYLKMLNLK